MTGAPSCRIAVDAAPAEAVDIVGAALARLPAACLLGGFVALVFGLAPRWATALGWYAVALTFVVGQLADSLDLPQAIRNLSPFTHVPASPATDLSLLPLMELCLLAVAGAGAAVSVGLFRRRDLDAGA
jgi:ABC-2 type transport system permease protein